MYNPPTPACQGYQGCGTDSVRGTPLSPPVETPKSHPDVRFWFVLVRFPFVFVRSRWFPLVPVGSRWFCTTWILGPLAFGKSMRVKENQ